MDVNLPAELNEYRDRFLEVDLAHKKLKRAIDSLVKDFKQGGIHRMLLEGDADVYSTHNTAPTSEHWPRVERLEYILNDVQHMDVKNKQSEKESINYYGIIGVSSHTMETVREVNRAKQALRDALPDERQRLNSGLSVARAILRELPEVSPRTNILAITRILTEVPGIDPHPTKSTLGPLEGITFSVSRQLKARRISFDSGYDLARKWAINNNVDPEALIASLPSTDGKNMMTLYDKRPHEQGTVQMLYRDPKTNKRVQRVVKTAMPCFYDASISPKVVLRRAKPQKFKSPGKGDFQGNRLVLDMGDTALCLPPKKSLTHSLRSNDEPPF